MLPWCRSSISARPHFLQLSYLPLLGALSLSVLLILFGSGPAGSSAKVNLGPVQPIEAIRLLLALFLAGYFARRWELLRQIARSGRSGRSRAGAGCNVPRVDYVLPVLGGRRRGAGVLLPAEGSRPGAVAVVRVPGGLRRRPRPASDWRSAGLALLVAGFYVGYRLNVSATLADARTDVAVALGQRRRAAAIRLRRRSGRCPTGGLFGTGLGLGDTRYLPAGHTDLVLAAVGEELGVVGLLVVAAAYALDRLARLPHRAVAPRTTTASFSRRRSRCF